MHTGEGGLVVSHYVTSVLHCICACVYVRLQGKGVGGHWWLVMLSVFYIALGGGGGKGGIGGQCYKCFTLHLCVCVCVCVGGGGGGYVVVGGAIGGQSC